MTAALLFLDLITDLFHGSLAGLIAGWRTDERADGRSVPCKDLDKSGGNKAKEKQGNVLLLTSDGRTDVEDDGSTVRQCGTMASDTAPRKIMLTLEMWRFVGQTSFLRVSVYSGVLPGVDCA